VDEREAGRGERREARLLWMRGKLAGWKEGRLDCCGWEGSWQGGKKEGKTVVDMREACSVKGRKARLLWMRRKLAGWKEGRLDCCGWVGSWQGERKEG
jgi:hypothetical protein